MLVGGISDPHFVHMIDAPVSHSCIGNGHRSHRPDNLAACCCLNKGPYCLSPECRPVVLRIRTHQWGTMTVSIWIFIFAETSISNLFETAPDRHGNRRAPAQLLLNTDTEG